MQEDKKINYGDRVVKKNSIMSVLYKILSVGLSFISTPLLLACLGEFKYGVWASLLSIISWIYYFDLGVGNGLRNKVTSSLAKEEYEITAKYIGTSYFYIAIMSMILFAVAFLISNIIDIKKVLNINSVDENIKICLLIALLLACINFVLSLVNNLLFALQKAALVSFFSVIGQIFFIIGLVIYTATGKGFLLGVALIEGISQIIKNIIESVYIFKCNPELRFSLDDIEVKYGKEIMSFGVQIFVIQMAALILNSTDNIIITKLYGAAAVTPYSLCYKYFNMINTFYVALITPFLSAYTAAFSLGNIKWIKSTIKKNIMLYILVFIGTIVAAMLFKPFSIIWLNVELIYEKGIIGYTALYFVLLMFNHVFSTFLTGISMIKETMIATVIGAIMNIPVSVFLAEYIGLGSAGVILGSVVSLLISTLVSPIKTLHIIKNIEKY